MKRKQGHWLDFFQILLSGASIVLSVLLILDWKKYDFCFCILFGIAAVLFALLGIKTAVQKQKKAIGTTIAYMIATIIMIAFFTGSFLVILL